MFGKKGIDGAFYAMCLLIGLLLGLAAAWYLSNNGILTSLMCPVAPAVP